MEGQPSMPNHSLQRRNEERKAAGRAAHPPCIDCGGQAMPPYQRCPSCELRNHYQQEGKGGIERQKKRRER